MTPASSAVTQEHTAQMIRHHVSSRYWHADAPPYIGGLENAFQLGLEGVLLARILGLHVADDAAVLAPQLQCCMVNEIDIRSTDRIHVARVMAFNM